MAAVWASELDDLRRLLMLQDRIEAYTALKRTGDISYVVVAPPGWAGGVSEFYGMRVMHSEEVTRPLLALEMNYLA